MQNEDIASVGSPKSTSLRSATGIGIRLRLFRVLGYLPNLAFLVFLILVWQFASTVWLPRIDPHMAVLMPAPTSIAKTAAAMIASGELLYNLLASLRREATAFLFAATAIPLGMAMGWWRVVYNQVNPVMEILRPIPPLAWIPLSILWFGLGDEQNEFIIFLGMFFPILVNTIVGVKNIEPNLVRAARSLGAPERKVLWRVVLHRRTAADHHGRADRARCRVDGPGRGRIGRRKFRPGLSDQRRAQHAPYRHDRRRDADNRHNRSRDRYRHPAAEPTVAALVPGIEQIGSSDGQAGGERTFENLRRARRAG